MLLGNYFHNINKKHKKLFFSGISFDTKKIKKNYIFFAIKGNNFDGNKFIHIAIKKGAKVIVTEKKVKQQKKSNSSVDFESIVKNASEYNNYKLLATIIDVSDMDELKDHGNFLLNKIKSGVAMLGAIINNKPSIVIAVTNDLIKKDLKAGDLAKEIGSIMGGGGGGKPNLATAGGKDKKSLEIATKKAIEIFKLRIKEVNAV